MPIKATIAVAVKSPIPGMERSWLITGSSFEIRFSCASISLILDSKYFISSQAEYRADRRGSVIELSGSEIRSITVGTTFDAPVGIKIPISLRIPLVAFILAVRWLI